MPRIVRGERPDVLVAFSRSELEGSSSGDHAVLPTMPSLLDELLQPPSLVTGIGRRWGVESVLRGLGASPSRRHWGPYELREKLGEGGMGEVFAAHDPLLRRDVALKVLRVSAADGNARLRREARVLARLSHPNVVQVLTVGETEAQPWIAMELVRGPTLAQWMKRSKPGSRRRFEAGLQLLAEAGRGLAAAHALGIVHRDFKPSNVLVGPEGAKVADFGLARGVRSESRLGETNPTPRSEDDFESRSGVVVGTPRYMSPEQHRGHRCGPRGDQFSFSVTAWEVLFGVTPFEGTSHFDLCGAIEARRIRSGASCRGSSRVRAVLRRGFAFDPSERYPSMNALLEALRGSRRSRSKTAMVVLGLAGVVVWSASGVDASETGCDRARAQAELATVWGDQRRSSVRSALLSTEMDFAQTAVVSLEQELEGFESAWVEQRGEVCEGGRDPEVRPAALASRLRCLQGQLQTVDTLLTRIESAPPAVIAHVTDAAQALPQPRLCDDPGATRSPFDAELAEALEDDLGRARAAALLDDFEEAEALAVSVATRAGKAGLRSLQGDAQELEGRVVTKRSPDQGRDASRQAHATAVELGQWRRAAIRAVQMAFAEIERGEIEAVERWLRHAESASQRLGQPADLRMRIGWARCDYFTEQRSPTAPQTCREPPLLAKTPSDRWNGNMRLAQALIKTGRANEGLQLQRQLLEEARETYGPQHSKVGGMLNNIATTLVRQQEFEEALTMLQAAAEVFRTAYGPRHRWVAAALMNAGVTQRYLGELDAATATLEEAAELISDPPTRQTARLLQILADIQREQGRLDEALATLERVQTIEADTLGPGHPHSVFTLTTRGILLTSLERYTEGRAALEAAVRLELQAPPSPSLGLLYGKLAWWAESRGDVDRALAFGRLAWRYYEPFPSPDDDERAWTVARQASLWIEVGEFERARPHVAEAMRLVGNGSGDEDTRRRSQEAARELASHDARRRGRARSENRNRE